MNTPVGVSLIYDKQVMGHGRTLRDEQNIAIHPPKSGIRKVGFVPQPSGRHFCNKYLFNQRPNGNPLLAMTHTLALVLVYGAALLVKKYHRVFLRTGHSLG